MPQDPQALQEFARSLAGRNPKTVKAYVSNLRNFLAWLSEQPGGKPFRPEAITATAIQGYMDSLAAAGRSANTRSQALTALRRFCRWAIAEGMLQRNPTDQIERPTIVATAPRELTPKQRYVLKNLIESDGTNRTTAIFGLGYWAGLRISEVAKLKITDCDVNQRAGVITVVDAKGGKTRILDLHNNARRALYDYIYERTDAVFARDPESAYVFTGERAAWLRRQGSPDHLSTRGIAHLWKALKRRAGQDELALVHDIRFHDLRHDFAHRARQAGWDLEEIAVYLGHQTKAGTPAIATTVRYTLPSRKQIKQQIHRLSG